jgi:hypothetical protein
MGVGLEAREYGFGRGYKTVEVNGDLAYTAFAIANNEWTDDLIAVRVDMTIHPTDTFTLTLESDATDRGLDSELLLRPIANTPANIALTLTGARAAFILEPSSTQAREQINVALRNSVTDIAWLRVDNPLGRLLLYGGRVFDLSEQPLTPSEVHPLQLTASRPMFLAGRPSTDAISLTGASHDILYRDVQLVASGWNRLAPELQATLVTACLSLVTWLLLRFGRSWYSVTWRLATESRNSPSLSPSPRSGQIILLLTSGREIAGDIQQSPSSLDSRYVLANCLVRSNNDNWKSLGHTGVYVERAQVEMSYMVESA